MLQLEAIGKQLGDTPVLSNVSLSLGEGESVVLMDPSGAGKTTLLRTIAGLERPDSGRLVHGGDEWAGPANWAPPWERRVGMVFQDLALWPHMTATQTLEFALRQLPEFRKRNPRRQKAAQLLAELELGGLEKRLPSELSGGQQQRLALGRALAAQPRILLLDEAFNQLDLDLRGRLQQFLDTLRATSGMTLLIVSHQWDHLTQSADQWFRMEQGGVWELARQEAERVLCGVATGSAGS